MKSRNGAFFSLSGSSSSTTPSSSAFEAAVQQAVTNPKAAAVTTLMRLSTAAVRVVRSSPDVNEQVKEAKVRKIEEAASCARKIALDPNDENHDRTLNAAHCAVLEEDQGGVKAEVWSMLAEDLGHPLAKLTPGKW
jgi:hypothetical protein